MNEIKVPSFVNPYLFWVVDLSVQSQHSFIEIQKALEETPNGNSQERFKEGEIVGAYHENIKYRATIEKILPNNKFLCWLLDCGFLVETQKLCKLPLKLKKIPPSAKQACLNNIVFIEQQLTFGTLNASIVEKSSTCPNRVCREIVMDYLSKGVNLKFEMEKKESGVLFGDLIITMDDTPISISQLLVDKNIMKFDKDLFYSVEEHIHTLKEAHLSFLYRLSRKTKGASETNKLNISNIDLSDYEERDTASSESFFSRRKRLSIKSDSENNVNSPKLVDETKTSPPLSSNRRHFEYLKKRLSRGTSSVKEESDSDVSSAHCSSESSKQNQENITATPQCEILPEKTNEEKSKMRQLLEKIKARHLTLASKNSLDEKCQSLPTTTSGSQTRKTLPLCFVPAGASHSFIESKSKSTTINTSPHVSKNSNSNNSNLTKNSTSKNDNSDLTKNSTSNNDNSDLTKNSTSNNDSDLNIHRTKILKNCISSEEDKSNCQTKDISQIPGEMRIAPTCSCSTCNFYSYECCWQPKQNKEFIKDLKVCRPLPLFKTGSAENTYHNVKSITYTELTKIEKEKAVKVLVHGKNFPTPVTSISKLMLHPIVHKSLMRRAYTEFKRIQTYASPAIARNQNVFLVNNKRTGKTMSYLPVICSQLLERENYTELAPHTGPVALILCSNSKNCEEIYDLIKVLFKHERLSLKVVLATYPIQHINNRDPIDILITMPPVLTDILKQNYLNLKRLCHLIIEDADIIFNSVYATMEILFNLVDDMLSHRVCSHDVQLILVAEKWIPHFSQLAKKMTNSPTICIGNFLEAALYSKIDLQVKFLSSSMKIVELERLLKDKFNIYKTIVLCNDDDLAIIENVLLLSGIDAFVIKSEMSKEEILEIEELWNITENGKYKVLVCTDEHFNINLTLTYANMLIHYSLSSSWTRFTKRFMCFLETIKSPLSPPDKEMLKSVVFADENCLQQMPKFFSYIEKLSINLPENIREFHQNLVKEKENKKIEEKLPLCHHLKLFGEKCKREDCKLRHTLDKALDISEHYPKTGKIKFKIVSVEDPSHYIVKIVDCGKEKKLDSGIDITKMLTSDMDDTKMIADSKPVIRHLYAYYDIDGDNMFYRCSVDSILEEEAKIYLLDTGATKTVLKSRLYVLPENYKKIPSSVVEVYLANFLPPYGDQNYSTKSYKRTITEIEKESTFDDLILTGDIFLQLSNIFWLKNVVREVELENTVVVPFQLSKRLLQQKLVYHSESQLRNLYNLCKDAGIVLPTFEKPLVKPVHKREQVNPQWAFLDTDNIEEVTFGAGVSPNEFYVRLNKFSSIFYNLQKDIQLYVKKPCLYKNFPIEVGKCYLVKDPEGSEYCRATVIEKFEDDRTALLFCVDFGDFVVSKVDELKFLPNNIITQLPFQSIFCSLHGINPALDEWQEDALNALYEYSLEPNTDIFRTLYIKTCVKEKSNMSGRNKYSVLLKDGFGDKKTLINNLLVDCGMAVLADKDVLEDFEIPNSPDLTEEDVEEIANDEEDDLDVKYSDDGLVFDDADFEICIEKPEDFLKDLLRANLPAPSAPQLCDRPKNDYLPAIKAAPPVDFYTPEVYWSQTESNITMKIKIPCVEEYDTSVKKGRIFKLNTNQNGKNYQVKHMLYERVEEKFQHTALASEIRVVFQKLKNILWPRLIISKEKVRHIHYDCSTIEVEDEPKRKFLEIPDISDADDTDSDDSLVYHVVSDQDSEFGEDLDMSD